MGYCTVSQWQASAALHAIQISFSFGRHKDILKEVFFWAALRIYIKALFFWAALRIYKGTFLLGGAKNLATWGKS